MIFLIVTAVLVYLFIVYNPLLFIFCAVAIGCAVLTQIASINNWYNN